MQNARRLRWLYSLVLLELVAKFRVRNFSVAINIQHLFKELVDVRERDGERKVLNSVHDFLLCVRWITTQHTCAIFRSMYKRKRMVKDWLVNAGDAYIPSPSDCLSPCPDRGRLRVSSCTWFRSHSSVGACTGPSPATIGTVAIV